MPDYHDIGLAELLAAYGKLGSSYSLDEIADILGFRIVREEPERTTHDAESEEATVGQGEPFWSDQPATADDLVPESRHIRIDYEPAGAAESSGNVAMPLPEDPVERELERDPLFAPDLRRDIVRRTLSTAAPSTRLHVGKLIQQLSHLQPLRDIPRQMRPTLRNGVQVLRDIGESMAHFEADQQPLVDYIRTLVGHELVEELRCVGPPDPTCWDADGRRKYAPPAAGTPVLVLSDLGIGRPPLVDESVTPADWLRFFRLLEREECPIVAYVPYEPARWPRMFRHLVDLHSWDRPLLPVGTRRAAAEPKNPAAEMINQVAKRRPWAVDLAQRLSLAAQIEPGLLRAARLQLTRWVGASAETDLLFSPLIETAGPTAAVLAEDVQRELQRQLAESGQLELAWSFLDNFRQRQGAPEAMRLEEQINHLFCQAIANEQALDLSAMEKLLAQILRSITDDQQGDKRGLVHWTLRALPRMPPELRDTRSARALIQAARLRATVVTVGDLDDGAESEIGKLFPADMPSVPIGVRWTTDELVFSDPPGAGEVEIDLVATHPRVLLLKEIWQSRFELTAGESVSIPLSQSAGESTPDYRIQSLTGETYRLSCDESTCLVIGRLDEEFERLYREIIGFFARMHQKVYSRNDMIQTNCF